MHKHLELIIRLNDLELLYKEFELGSLSAAAEENLGFSLGKREKVSKAREEIRSQVDRRLLSRFDTIFKKYGKAVAPVLNGVAYCCYEKLPVNLCDANSENLDITNCPYCGRFLYFLE
jgi:predicted  nucleic acid-binding Zn-ribbon protein